jgi:hypothetical protein
MVDAAAAAPVRTALALALMTLFCIFVDARHRKAATHREDYGTNLANPIRPTAYMWVRIGCLGERHGGSPVGNRTLGMDRDRRGARSQAFRAIFCAYWNGTKGLGVLCAVLYLLGCFMSETGADSGFYRTKAAHMRRLADQSHNEIARSTYLLLEASWLRLAATAEKAKGSQAH